MSFSLAPGLLIAMPSLDDPSFHRAVVLMCAHNDDGAFGLVLNRTIDLPVATVCADADVQWDGSDLAKVHDGGPCERQRGWVLHSAEETFDGSQVVGDGVSLTASHSALEAFGRDESGPFRLLLGYAGWSPGQLESEVAEGAWLTAPVSAEIVFRTSQDATWRAALASVGVNPANLVESGNQLN